MATLVIFKKRKWNKPSEDWLELSEPILLPLYTFPNRNSNRQRRYHCSSPNIFANSSCSRHYEIGSRPATNPHFPPPHHAVCYAKHSKVVKLYLEFSRHLDITSKRVIHPMKSRSETNLRTVGTSWIAETDRCALSSFKLANWLLVVEALFLERICERNWLWNAFDSNELECYHSDGGARLVTGLYKQ